MRNCDAFFTSTSGARLAAAGTTQAVDEAEVLNRIMKQVSDIKAEGRKFGREIEVYTQGQVICRPTQREAEEYHHYANVENADWGAIDRMLALKNITPQNTAVEAFAAKRRMMASSGIGGYPFVGTPDKVAAEFADHARAGFRGLAVSFVNYLNDAPYFCAEVLPRLARMGLRANN
jgi:alkanesulfonate monooxygenase SsuD/methylene tetrahydromethanopterin reductase-like flavin-dependent oxidoreductase (luciferase family)